MRVPRAQARIDDDVEHVDGEVDDDDRRREQHDDVADDEQVAVGDRLEDEPAEAGQREHLLDHDRAGEQVGELQAHHGEHRHHRVSQHVAPEHAARRLALGARGADEVLAQHVEHRRADDARRIAAWTTASATAGSTSARSAGPAPPPSSSLQPGKPPAENQRSFTANSQDQQDREPEVRAWRCRSG